MNVARYVVTVVGLATIVWVLWYFLCSRGPATAATIVESEGRGAQERPSASPHRFHE